MASGPGNMDSLSNRIDGDIQGPSGSLEDSLHTELESILREHRNRSVIDRERDLNIYRSGSAPPTVEGSLSAVDGLFGSSDYGEFSGSRGLSNNGVPSEEEFRSHPAYMSYYYSNDGVNPRLPPPLLSREDWRVAQRFQAGGSSMGAGSGDWRKKQVFEDGESSSLFLMQPGLSLQRAESDLMELRNSGGRNQTRQISTIGFDRGSGSSIGSASSGLGARRKSFADILQEGAERPSLSNFLSRPSSRNNFSDEAENFVGLHNGVVSHDLPAVQGHSTSIPYSLGSFGGSSLSRSTTPEPKFASRSPGSGLPPVGSRVSQIEQKNIRSLNVKSGHSSGMNELADIAANLSGLSLSNLRNRDVNNHGLSQLNLELDSNSEFLFKSGYNENLHHDFMDNSNAENLYTGLARINGTVNNINASKMSSNMHLNFPKRTSSFANLYSQAGSSVYGSLDGSNAHHQSATTNFVPSGGFSVNQKRNSAIDTHLDTVMTSLGNEAGPDLHSPLNDPRYIHFLQRNPDYAARAANVLGDLSLNKNRISSSHGELEGFQKAYLENLLLAQQREQLELSLLGKSSGFSHDNYALGSYGLGTAYQGNTTGNSVIPTVGSGSLMFPTDRISRFNSMTRNSMRRSTGSLNSDISNTLEGRSMSSLLDEFKNNKIKAFELPDIVDHVVEFSMDQYGSRFIQQKLETATAEEKTKIFPEIIPHVHSLMTDVFGNYVIQKFFEHGTESQRKELANQLTGHVLPLSLQMYGCRVIQKALEVVDVDQQTQMVAELDGSIMKCVRDQNGNHVIQKCIECAPQDRIQFIISAFYGQVVVLSTHPYGCRVIQRVLEHCNDPNTQKIIMNEIMQSVCMLAQDQYGNYVIQHVLQHGKPEERSAIICKLAGQIVRMSQQKFASNVVEKCLTFGSPEERQILVNEMLGSTEENEPLQAMMKDPFGNYVVQKVLETCNDESLELLLSRIKAHLNTLKRYTYGKHIVSRIEKLIATGERRIGLSSMASSEPSQFATTR